MKLLRYGSKGSEKPGVEINGIRYDCSEHFKDWDRAFFQSGGLGRLNEIVREGSLPKIENNIRLGSPIARPGMIMCVGLNYSDHAAESGMDVPKEPVLFMKATNTLSGPNDDVEIPKNSEKTDWEVELGIVLGRDITYLEDEDAAEDAIAGYCLVHDISERTFQIERGGQWVKGKSCPGFSPVGPYLVTRDEIDDVLNLNMKLSVNGALRQNGNTKTMVFNPGHIVWYISQYMTLEAGDLISTGTPPGVGLGMKPPTYLKVGDKVELEIDGLGHQTQKFINHR